MVIFQVSLGFEDGLGRVGLGENKGLALKQKPARPF
jgi:hypothetical protein